MASGKRKRQQQDAPRKKARSELSAADEKAVDAELKRVNDMLQSEETSQKQTWQIGKCLKKLMETYPSMATQKTIDAFFLWGTALARLASLNEDPTLAEAAADKFAEMHALSSGDDSAMGPVGYSLWASSLLIVATETRQKDVLDDALSKFAQAVEVDGGTTFETHFQFAKALKEGGDLVQFLDASEKSDGDNSRSGRSASAVSYYKRALALCEKLEQIYNDETAKAAAAADSDRNEKEEPTASEYDDDKSDRDDEDDEDEDDDKVLVEDFAEVKLLQAVLHSAIEDDASSTRASFDTALALFKQALEISPRSPDALMELASYVSKTMLAHRPSLEAVDWASVVRDLEVLYTAALADAGFDIAECHAICVRKDTHEQEEPEGEAIDERVPHLLHALGKALAAFAVVAGAAPAPSGKQKRKQATSSALVSSPAFVHAVEVLRAAHHFHDKLGCYPLAWLYAYTGIEDEESCRTWLETAESYGVLDDELQVADFASMHDKPWFAKFLAPVEAISDDELHDDDASESGHED